MSSDADEMAFSFRGPLLSSKSIFNRALIIQSFAKQMRLVGDSQADDVAMLRLALSQMGTSRHVYDAGDGGTTLRFLAMRISRIPGSHRIAVSPSLGRRPNSELVEILTQLGVQSRWDDRGLEIHSEGWKIPSSGLEIDGELSSQFLSAAMLSAWELGETLVIQSRGTLVSRGYFDLTTSLLAKSGMKFEVTTDSATGLRISIAPHQVPLLEELVIEPDLSSAFSVAALAAVGGRADLLKWPADSQQPDRVFPELLRKMGCKAVVTKGPEAKIRIDNSKGAALGPLEADLSQAPDLFPVLASLCALANGKSRLYGAHQLRHKESDRITVVNKLLRSCHVSTREVSGGLEISGTNRFEELRRAYPRFQLQFDPENDHRMAMAAGVLKLLLPGLEVAHPEVVTKSFPNYWSIWRDGRRSAI